MAARPITVALTISWFTPVSITIELPTVIGLMLVSLARLALGTTASVKAMLASLAGITATLVRTTTGTKGRRPTIMLAPELDAAQRKAVRRFELGRWMPALLSCMKTRPAPA